MSCASSRNPMPGGTRCVDAEGTQELAEPVAHARPHLAANVDDRRGGQIHAPTRRLPLLGQRRECLQHDRDEQVVERHVPRLRGAQYRGELRRRQLKAGEAVGGIGPAKITRPVRMPAVQGQPGQAGHAAQNGQSVPPQKRQERFRIQAGHGPGGRRVPFAFVAGDDRLQQQHDRVAAGDEMVVGQREFERRPRRRRRRTGTDRWRRPLEKAGSAGARTRRAGPRADRRRRPARPAPRATRRRHSRTGPRAASSVRLVRPRASSSCRIAASRRRTSSGIATWTACTALYGCSSRQRSIVAWNRFSLPRISEPRAPAPAAPIGTSAASRCTRCRRHARCSWCRRPDRPARARCSPASIRRSSGA